MPSRPDQACGDRDHCLKILLREEERAARRTANQGNFDRRCSIASLCRHSQELKCAIFISSLEKTEINQTIDDESRRSR